MDVCEGRRRSRPIYFTRRFFSCGIRYFFSFHYRFGAPRFFFRPPSDSLFPSGKPEIYGQRPPGKQIPGTHRGGPTRDRARRDSPNPPRRGFSNRRSSPSETVSPSHVEANFFIFSPSRETMKRYVPPGIPPHPPKGPVFPENAALDTSHSVRKRYSRNIPNPPR